jgi:3-hydroxyisobutyryl-CoA hydrolase
MTFKTFCFVLYSLPLIKEQLGKLVTDDPFVIETTLEQYGDLVRPVNSSVLQRY